MTHNLGRLYYYGTERLKPTQNHRVSQEAAGIYLKV